MITKKNLVMRIDHLQSQIDYWQKVVETMRKERDYCEECGVLVKTDKMKMVEVEVHYNGYNGGDDIRKGKEFFCQNHIPEYDKKVLDRKENQNNIEWKYYKTDVEVDKNGKLKK